MIDVSDASLTDWDKDRTLMRGFTAEPPYVPFADIYLAWHPNGLYLATIGMDYMHPENVSYEESFPLSESYQLHLSAVIEGQAYHFAVHFMPHEVPFLLMNPRTGGKTLPLFPACTPTRRMVTGGHYRERRCSTSMPKPRESHVRPCELPGPSRSGALSAGGGEAHVLADNSSKARCSPSRSPRRRSCSSWACCACFHARCRPSPPGSTVP